MKTFLFVTVASASLAFPQQGQDGRRPIDHPLVVPATGTIPVAFVLTDGAVMIDFSGPWEVFQDVMVPSRGTRMEEQHVFKLYTVSDTVAPVTVSGGMHIVPDYTFDDAPAPKIVVVPAQAGRSPKMLDWIRNATSQADVVMSVCTGAFTLAEAGVLNGKPATTHHSAYTELQRQFPTILVQHGVRYVQSDPIISTAAGLSAGIDLALHIVDRYVGREIAQATAKNMEYEGQGWKTSKAEGER